MERVQVVIVGSGPAGLTAAIYTARADLAPLVFEGVSPGGQLTTTTLVENFPGFPDGIDGSELMDNMRKQAKRFGAKLIADVVEEADLKSHPFRIVPGSGEPILSDSLIIASGASAKWLGLPSEKNLRGYGVSSCATCDGFFFRGKKLAVVGGGDTAMEDALHLTRFATEVYVIHRRDQLRASKIMQDRAIGNPKIRFIWDTVVSEVYGSRETGVTGLKLVNVKTREISNLEVSGMFVAIGHHPNTEFLKGQLPVDPNGFLLSTGRTTTTVRGVFVAGDVSDPGYRQAITAAGIGCMAALETLMFLSGLPSQESGD